MPIAGGDGVDAATCLANEQDDLADARADQHEAEVSGDWQDAQRHAELAEQCASRINDLLGRIDDAKTALAADALRDHDDDHDAADNAWAAA